MQKIETPVGEVHVTMRVDHHGRETAEVELIPAEGCVIDFRSLKRELPVPPPDMPSKRELVRELKKARRWLSEPQPDGAAYPTHFGVGPKRAGAFRRSARPVR